MDLNKLDMSQMVQTAQELLVLYVPKLILALILLFVGFKVIGLFKRFLNREFEKRHFDESLRPFLVTLVSTALKVMLLISVASMVGIETTSFVAAVGAAGLAIGLAFQGSLSNLAGGVLILMFKPFKVGDFIEAEGHSGTVKEIQVFCTILNTVDNKKVILPNGPLATSSMVNYSAFPTRRVDITVGISYGDDFKKAKETVKKIIASNDKILKDPEPFVAVTALADSSVNIVLRSWVLSADYWGVYHFLIEEIKSTFDAEGISFPFPQMDVRLHKDS